MRRAPEDMRDADGGLTDEAQDAIDDQILAEHVLCEWEGLTDNGEPIPYSLDLAREWVGYSLFWSAVRVSMQHVTREARSAVESLAKNSQAPSGKKPKAA
ncbi:hypothetical protein [Tranquillimonas rosea]|uniref:hypothetical protein n=1 Tax=Tranquillimonas rosea TaxID=641238 RepID=UPI003BAD2C25